MTDFILHKDNQSNIFDTDSALSALIVSLPDFKTIWTNYIEETYEDYSTERLDYVDIAELARHIRDRSIIRQTSDFDKLFDTIELILNNCDDKLANFIIIGLMESIQNNCSHDKKINIYTGFDQWLKPTSKIHWDNLIYGWEGKDAIENYKINNPNDNRLIK